MFITLLQEKNKLVTRTLKCVLLGYLRTQRHIDAIYLTSCSALYLPMLPFLKPNHISQVEVINSIFWRFSYYPSFIFLHSSSSTTYSSSSITCISRSSSTTYSSSAITYSSSSITYRSSSTLYSSTTPNLSPSAFNIRS